MPANAHELATDRLFVSVTDTETKRNVIVSTYDSNEELIKVSLLIRSPNQQFNHALLFFHQISAKNMARYGGKSCKLILLGRLPKVDLIILEGEKMSVRTSVRPSTKSFFDLNEIWYIGRGR